MSQDLSTTKTSHLALTEHLPYSHDRRGTARVTNYSFDTVIGEEMSRDINAVLDLVRNMNNNKTPSTASAVQSNPQPETSFERLMSNAAVTPLKDAKINGKPGASAEQRHDTSKDSDKTAVSQSNEELNPDLGTNRNSDANIEDLLDISGERETDSPVEQLDEQP